MSLLETGLYVNRFIIHFKYYISAFYAHFHVFANNYVNDTVSRNLK